MPSQLLVLALDAALYPTLLAAVVVLLSQPKRVSLLGTYLASGLVISIGVGLGIVAALKGSGALHNSRSGLSWVTDLSIGGLVLLVAVALATRADARFRERRRRRNAAEPIGPDDAKEPFAQRVLAKGSVPLVIAASLAMNLPGAAYLVALKDIAAEHHPTGVDVALVVAFNAVMFLLAEVAFVGLLVRPERTVGLVNALNGWMSANGRRIAIGLCTVLGLFLVIRGVIRS